jgi:DNA-binding NtrC family response regulator
MDKPWDILVVSARLENKKALLRILQGLSVSAFTASTLEQAHEVLSARSIRLIFCEENFADGSYRDLLSAVHTPQTRTPLVLMLSTGEWEEYLEAMSLGATEALRCPLQPTDVELTLIRVAREYERQIERPAQIERTNRSADSVSASSTAN